MLNILHTLSDLFLGAPHCYDVKILSINYLSNNKFNSAGHTTAWKVCSIFSLIKTSPIINSDYFRKRSLDETIQSIVSGQRCSSIFKIIICLFASNVWVFQKNIAAFQFQYLTTMQVFIDYTYSIRLRCTFLILSQLIYLRFL